MERLPEASACLPRLAGPVRLDLLGPEGLVTLRILEDREDFERVTCRPVIRRTRMELLALYQDALKDRSKLICGLFLPGITEPAGKLTAFDYNPRNRSVELGYFLSPLYRGKGYMGKALSSFCTLLLEELELNKVYAQTGAFNISSIRLLERSGFQRDGILRQHHALDDVLWDDYIYSLLAEQLHQI